MTWLLKLGTKFTEPAEILRSIRKVSNLTIRGSHLSLQKVVIISVALELIKILTLSWIACSANSVLQKKKNDIAKLIR